MRLVSFVTFGFHFIMLVFKYYSLSLSLIACKTRLDREVTLEDRIWAQKLIEHNAHARGIWERLQR